MPADSNQDQTPISVFISYIRESDLHAQKVLAMADDLREWGIDVRLDQYIQNPDDGWATWTSKQITTCDFVLLVCTSSHRKWFEGENAGPASEGARWEVAIATQLLYEAGAKNGWLIPVLFTDGEEEDVPLPFRAYTRYQVPKEFEDLYRLLTNQHKNPAPPIGRVREMSPLLRPSLLINRGKEAAPRGTGEIIDRKGGLAFDNPQEGSSRDEPPATEILVTLADVLIRLGVSERLPEQLIGILQDPDNFSELADAIFIKRHFGDAEELRDARIVPPVESKPWFSEALDETLHRIVRKKVRFVGGPRELLPGEQWLEPQADDVLEVLIGANVAKKVVDPGGRRGYVINYVRATKMLTMQLEGELRRLLSSVLTLRFGEALLRKVLADYGLSDIARFRGKEG